jgi:hypothetical protein
MKNHKKEKNKKIKQISKNIVKHITKISKIEDPEDLFILSNNLTEENLEKLTNIIKKNADKNILKNFKKSKNPIELKEILADYIFEKTIDKFEEMKEKISEKRKKGKDTFISELKLMSMQYKMKLFKATKDKKDYLKIKRLIREIEKDIS